MKTRRSLHILMLCARHNAFDGRVFYLEARALRDAGHQVTIIAPKKADEPDDFTHEGIRVVTFRKLRSRLPRKLHTLYQLCRLAVSLPADVFHAHEVDAALLAGAYAKRRLARAGHAVRLVFDVHEVWPYFYAAWTECALFQRAIVHGVIEYENWMLRRHVDAVITAHELEKHVYLWHNPWLSVRHVLTAPEFDDPPPPERSGPIRVIGHEGFFTLNRGMDVLLNAFEWLARENRDLTLLTAGDFLLDSDRHWFDAWARRTGLRDRVHLSGWVNRPELTGYLDRMDIGVAGVRADDHSARIWPANKLMNYASRAVPAVASAAMPYVRQRVEEPGIGVVSEFSASDLYETLRSLIADPESTRAMGRRAQEFARREWNWERAHEQLLRLYDDLAVPTLRPRRTMKLQG